MPSLRKRQATNEVVIRFSKNSLGALFELKRKKMLEKEVAKLEGQMVLLEQQRMMIQCNTNMADVSYSKYW